MAGRGGTSFRQTSHPYQYQSRTEILNRSGGEVHVGLTNSILRRQLHVVRVEELQKGAVHGVRELVYFNHLLHVFIPVRLEH